MSIVGGGGVGGGDGDGGSAGSAHFIDTGDGVGGMAGSAHSDVDVGVVACAELFHLIDCGTGEVVDGWEDEKEVLGVLGVVGVGVDGGGSLGAVVVVVRLHLDGVRGG